MQERPRPRPRWSAAGRPAVAFSFGVTRVRYSDSIQQGMLPSLVGCAPLGKTSRRQVGRYAPALGNAASGVRGSGAVGGACPVPCWPLETVRTKESCVGARRRRLAASCLPNVLTVAALPLSRSQLTGDDGVQLGDLALQGIHGAARRDRQTRREAPPLWLRHARKEGRRI